MKYLLIIFLFCSCTNTYYVVRHAEKVLIPANASDPTLTDAGVKRSNNLNNFFGNKKPDSIFISKYLRNKLTAQPTAAAARITPVIVNQSDPTNINAFINRLKKMHNKKVLVVGHSNTVPLIVKGLSGKDVNPIADNDYDNMYIIKFRKKSRLLNQTTYGAVSP